MKINNPSRPKVDIIIPFHGNYELVTKAISSINQCTPNNVFSIILVDDASPNRSYLEFISKANKKVVGLRLEERFGFSGSINEGIKRSKNSHIVVMHSDVQPNNIYWLSGLQKSLQNNKNNGIKLVVSRTNDVGTGGTHEGLVGEQKHNYQEDIIATSPLPLHCVLFHKDLFNRIGGGLKNYPYAWFEDVELFYRMKHFGFRQAISIGSYVNHQGGATIDKLPPKIKKIMNENKSLCLKDIKKFL